MKKLLIFLVVILVAGGGLFAQDLTWTGGVMFGLGFSSKDEEAPTVFDENFWWGDNDWGDGKWSKAAGQIEANYSRDNARVILRVRSYFSNAKEFSIGVPLAKVEFDLFNKIVGIRAGRLDELLWNPTPMIDFWQVTEGVGTLVEVKPIEGLTIGGILKTDGPKGGVKNAEELFKRAAFGASYRKDDLLYAAASLQLSDGARSDVDTNGDNKIEDDEKEIGGLNDAFYGLYGLNLLLVPNLILNTGGRFDVRSGGDSIDVALNQEIGYKIIPDTLKAALYAKENFADNTGLTFRPYAEYVINSSFTAWLEVQADIPNLDDPKIDIYVQPKITFNVAPSSSIIGYYKATIPNSGDVVHAVKFTFSSTF
jgi:hypothetical protein